MFLEKPDTSLPSTSLEVLEIKFPENCTECSQLELYKILECRRCPVWERAEQEGIKEQMDMET